MNEETTLLVNAINGLRQEPNYIMDYVFPIASAFFTSVLGAGIAYFTLKHQEGVKIEKDKMDAANKWIFSVEDARATLFAIKGNYHGELSENPLQRLVAIPSILFHADPIEESYQDLSFILPTSEALENGNHHKWSQILRIRSMVSNYNYLLKLWEQRNEKNEKFKEGVIIHNGDNGFAILSIDDAIAAFGRANVVILMDFTERVIKLTDDLIVETDDFLCEFPAYAKTKVEIKRLKRYGSIMTYSNDGNQKLLDLLVKSPEVDFTPFENLFGEPSEIIKNRHSTGYE